MDNVIKKYGLVKLIGPNQTTINVPKKTYYYDGKSDTLLELIGGGPPVFMKSDATTRAVVMALNKQFYTV